uniref:Male-enhanced antigen 1 n=1 Tax=Serinus canaria TaxID=9135 RepID=A0A8C9NNS2_SERCA
MATTSLQAVVERDRVSPLSFPFSRLNTLSSLSHSSQDLLSGPFSSSSRLSPAGLGAPAVKTPAARLSPQMLRLHLPDPPVDSEEENEEEAAEGAAAQSSHSSIPMDAEHVELVKRTMASVKLPTLGIPAWANQISEEQWKDVVQRTLQARQSLGGPRPQWN